MYVSTIVAEVRFLCGVEFLPPSTGLYATFYQIRIHPLYCTVDHRAGWLSWLPQVLDDVLPGVRFSVFACLPEITVAGGSGKSNYTYGIDYKYLLMFNV